MTLLPESALARGARPHWLGHIALGGAGSAASCAESWVQDGAQRLGAAAGTSIVLRDPGGAVVALTDDPVTSVAGVAWHQLNTQDAERAAALYSMLFSWSISDSFDLGALGQHRSFAYEAAEPSVGIFSDVAGRPRVHAHWLFFFTVASLDVALERVKTLGGIVIGPIALPGGARVAACDDAQGAAFGLVEAGDIATIRRVQAASS